MIAQAQLVDAGIGGTQPAIGFVAEFQRDGRTLSDITAHGKGAAELQCLSQIVEGDAFKEQAGAEAAFQKPVVLQAVAAQDAKADKNITFIIHRQDSAKMVVPPLGTFERGRCVFQLQCGRIQCRPIRKIREAEPNDNLLSGGL